MASDGRTDEARLARIRKATRLARAAQAYASPSTDVDATPAETLEFLAGAGAHEWQIVEDLADTRTSSPLTRRAVRAILEGEART